MSDKPCFGHAAFPFDECLACRALAAETERENFRQQLAAAEAAINSLQSQLASANKMLVEAWNERDEARAAARWCYERPYLWESALERWPWLADTQEDKS